MDGHSDTILLLKREFPEIKPSSFALISASMFGHHDTEALLKKEFPDIMDD
jgi:hypothetical protein